MISFPNTPMLDLCFGDSPEEVSRKYNLPLEKVIEFNEKLITILDGDSGTDSDLFILCEQYELF